jgi:polyhydroxybutyrate depolymerase
MWAVTFGSPHPGRRRGGPRRVLSRSDNTVWLPITAAAGVLVLLLWYALSQKPTKANVDPSQGSGLAAAAAAAGPSGAAAAGGGVSAAPIATPTGPSGCDTGRGQPAGTTTETLTVGTTRRSYLLAVPAVAATAPLPVILDFPGDGQTAADMESYTGLAAAGTKEGFVVVTPAGAGNRWNFIRSAAVGPDDVAFIGGLLADLRTRMCVAADRIFAAGVGDGADMAVAASCAMPGRIAAIVSVAGSTVPTNCAKATAHLFEIHGTADTIAPWDGGGPPRAAPFAAVTAQPVPARLGRYAAVAGCTAPPNTQALNGLGELTSWACQGKPDVGVLAAAGGGHTWPQAPARPALGPTVTRFSATTISLLYFKSRTAAAPAAAAPPTPTRAAAPGSAG